MDILLPMRYGTSFSMDQAAVRIIVRRRKNSFHVNIMISVNYDDELLDNLRFINYLSSVKVLRNTEIVSKT